jgi:putative acetyltransferase
MEIRPETPQDIFAIRELTEAAFAPMPYSDGSEAQIIDRLREEGNLTLSLVTLDQDQVLAHIAFSPVTIDRTQGNWCGLGPVSVAPSWQKQGIGTT